MKPPTGSLSCCTGASTTALVALIFSERLDAANEKDKVMMAANAMRRNALTFIVMGLKGLSNYLPALLIGSDTPPPPLSSVLGVISSSVQEVTASEVVNAIRRT